MSVAPLQFLLLVFAGWVNRGQREVVEYLREENRILREQIGGRRLRFTDAPAARSRATRSCSIPRARRRAAAGCSPTRSTTHGRLKGGAIEFIRQNDVPTGGSRKLTATRE